MRLTSGRAPRGARVGWRRGDLHDHRGHLDLDADARRGLEIAVSQRGSGGRRGAGGPRWVPHAAAAMGAGFDADSPQPRESAAQARTLAGAADQLLRVDDHVFSIAAARRVCRDARVDPRDRAAADQKHGRSLLRAVRPLRDLVVDRDQAHRRSASAARLGSVLFVSADVHVPARAWHTVDRRPEAAVQGHPEDAHLAPRNAGAYIPISPPPRSTSR